MSRFNYVGFLSLFFVLSVGTHAYAQDNKVYNHVMETQTIRCGYAEWPPFLTIDPNTNQVSGLIHELYDMIGQRLGLKVEWTTLLGWGEIVDAVRTGKVDMFCTGVWPDAGRVKNLLLSRAVLYNAAYMYSRIDDKRFDNNYEAFNDPATTLVGQEGDITQTVDTMKYPKAKQANISPSAQQGEMFLMVTSKKGDLALMEAAYSQDYMKQNPGKIKRVAGPPVILPALMLPMAVGETQLKNMIDTVLNDFINDGTITALIKKYNAVETYAPEPDVKIPSTK